MIIAIPRISAQERDITSKVQVSLPNMSKLDILNPFRHLLSTLFQGVRRLSGGNAFEILSIKIQPSTIYTSCLRPSLANLRFSRHSFWIFAPQVPSRMLFAITSLVTVSMIARIVVGVGLPHIDERGQFFWLGISVIFLTKYNHLLGPFPGGRGTSIFKLNKSTEAEPNRKNIIHD